MRAVVVLAFLSLSLLAQETTAPAPPDSHQTDYWRARAKFAEAQIALEAAQKEKQASIDALVKDCGDKHIPHINDDGSITCVAKN